MATKEELDAAISNLGEALSTFASDFQAALDALNAKIQTGGDVTAEISALGALSESIAALDAKAKAVITPTA